MRRRKDWRTRLRVALDAARQSGPFAWGANDCASFVARCVEAMTGEDVRARFPSDYGDAETARAALTELGFADLPSLAASVFEECPPAMAHEGDIMAIESPETGFALGICLGERIGVLSPNGYSTIRRSHAVRAFRVQ